MPEGPFWPSLMRDLDAHPKSWRRLDPPRGGNPFAHCGKKSDQDRIPRSAPRCVEHEAKLTFPHCICGHQTFMIWKQPDELVTHLGRGQADRPRVIAKEGAAEEPLGPAAQIA